MDQRDSGSARQPDVVNLVVTLLHARRWIAGGALLTTLAIVAWSLLQPRLYVASVLFTPQATQGAGVSTGALSLARQFGVNIGSEQAAESPQFYADLLRSRGILRSAVNAAYLPGERPATADPVTLVEYWELEPRGVRPAWHFATERLRDQLGVTVNPETNVVSVTVSTGDPALSEQIAARLIDLVEDFNLTVRQSQAASEAEFAERRLSEAQAELGAAEDSLKLFLQQNVSWSSSPPLTFEHDRLQRQVALRQEVVSSLAQIREQARIDRLRDLPLITIIAAPDESARPVSKGTLLRGLLALMGGGFLGLLVYLVRRNVRGVTEARSAAGSELARAREETLADLRRLVPRQRVR